MELFFTSNFSCLTQGPIRIFANFMKKTSKKHQNFKVFNLMLHLNGTRGHNTFDTARNIGHKNNFSFHLHIVSKLVTEICIAEVAMFCTFSKKWIFIKIAYVQPKICCFDMSDPVKITMPWGNHIFK